MCAYLSVLNELHSIARKNYKTFTKLILIESTREQTKEIIRKNVNFSVGES